MGLDDVRDVIIIAAGSLTILVLIALFIFTVVLGVTARALLNALRRTLREDVTPLLRSSRATVQRVQGTAAFISETAVSPVIRVYGVVAGARRLVAVVTGVTGARGRRKAKKDS